MKAQTLRFVPMSEVLSRLPAEVDRERLIDFFGGWTEYAWGTNSHSLVPWNVLMDDLADCFAELGYRQFSVRHVFPVHIFSLDPHTFVDLEN